MMTTLERSGTDVSDWKIGAVADHNVIITHVWIMQRKVVQVRGYMVGSTTVQQP